MKQEIVSYNDVGFKDYYLQTIMPHHILSLSMVVGMGPMPAIIDLWGYDRQKKFIILLHVQDP